MSTQSPSSPGKGAGKSGKSAQADKPKKTPARPKPHKEKHVKHHGPPGRRPPKKAHHLAAPDAEPSVIDAADAAYLAPPVGDGHPSPTPLPPPEPDHPVTGIAGKSGQYSPFRFGYDKLVGWPAQANHAQVQVAYDFANGRTATATVASPVYSVPTCTWGTAPARYTGFGVTAAGVFTAISGAADMKMRVWDAGAVLGAPHDAVEYERPGYAGAASLSLSFSAGVFTYTVTGLSAVPTGQSAFLYLIPARIKGDATGTSFKAWVQARTSVVQLAPLAGDPNKASGTTTVAQRDQATATETRFFGFVFFAPTPASPWDVITSKVDVTFQSLAVPVSAP